MTSLSNEQIVAELKWTEKAIVDIIGVTPIYWRPPYGDVDNRVRAIATQLGYKTSIWTQGFDTNDVSLSLSEYLCSKLGVVVLCLSRMLWFSIFNHFRLLRFTAKFANTPT